MFYKMAVTMLEEAKEEVVNLKSQLDNSRLEMQYYKDECERIHAENTELKDRNAGLLRDLYATKGQDAASL